MSVLLVAGAVTTPLKPVSRVYQGCMGRIVPGVPFIDGAYPENPELVFSWLLHRYPQDQQARILAAFAAAGDQDFLLSWADFSGSPVAFGNLIRSVQNAGFHPLVMLTSKAGPSDLGSLILLVAPLMPVLAAARVPRVCVGWELNDWISPGSVKVKPHDPGVLQPLIDWLAPQVRAWGGWLYVHFTQGYGAWQQDGLMFADFWNINVNKLRGVLHQKVMTQTDIAYQFAEGGLRDILLHFNGGSGCTADSGDGTPFDLVAFEVDLELFSENKISEAEMHRRARVGVATPSTIGPTGAVVVRGSGCGQ